MILSMLTFRAGGGNMMNAVPSGAAFIFFFFSVLAVRDSLTPLRGDGTTNGDASTYDRAFNLPVQLATA